MSINTLLISLGMFSLTFTCVSGQGSCSKINSCSCSFGDNTYVDLSPLKGNPKWQDQWDTSYLNQYSYNPCDGFTEGTCANVAVCQYTLTEYFACGSQDSASFVTDPTTGLLTLTYSSTDATGFTRTSNVVLKCIETGDDTLEVQGENPSSYGTYDFTLSSTHCCPKKGGGPSGTVEVSISVGSILTILFFCVLIFYFVVGALIQKFARKASGKEVVPNVAFWSTLPGLIKDGTLFVVRRGKTRTEYENI